MRQNERNSLLVQTIVRRIAHRFANLVCRDLVRPIEQLSVDAIALDWSIEAVPSASTALVALDVEHVELADQVAEKMIAPSRGMSPSNRVAEFRCTAQYIRFNVCTPWRNPDPVNAFRGGSGLASKSRSGAIIMPADPEACRMLASRCAEIAATAKTQQLKAWFSDLSMRWGKLAIELENSFATFVANDATVEEVWSRLDQGKRLSKSLHPKARQRARSI